MYQGVKTMKKGQTKRVWTKEQKLEIVHKHLDEHISIKKLGKEYRIYEQGLNEVKAHSFHENEIVLDSFGKRWIKCDQCGKIGQSDAFSWIGIRRDTPALGRCTACVRKMN
jgi:hypothetical protein